MTRTAADIAEDLQAIEDNKPTPETVRKLRPAPIISLWRAKRLELHEMQAAGDIAMIWRGFARVLSPHACNWEMPNGGGSWSDPVGRMRDREAIAYRDRYKPWLEKISETEFLVTHEVVVSETGLRDAERIYRLRNGTAFQHLKNALTRYAELAGWVTHD